MKGLGVGLLIAAGVLLLVIGTAGTVFYIKVYRPIGGPIAAMGIAKTLEERQLQNRAEWTRPGAKPTPGAAARLEAAGVGRARVLRAVG
jgi:hypothetical protein